MPVSSATSGVSHSQASLKSLVQPRRQDAEARRPSTQPDVTPNSPQEASSAPADVKVQAASQPSQPGQAAPALPAIPAGANSANAFAVSAYSSMMTGFQPKTSLSALA